MVYHLAIDIGASSGRHILGYSDGEKLILKEIYRFKNSITKKQGTLVWDIENLVEQVKMGIRKCKELDMLPETVAIDTWGVDYVLLDKDKREILPAVSYRDARTADIQTEVSNIVSQEYLYSRTGIQKQQFNTVYQLYCDKLSGKLKNAKYFLMMPEYLSFKLTGIIKNEYTNATTTNLINARTRTWDDEILDKLNIPKQLFGKLFMPTDYVGDFSKEVEREVGFSAKVIFCPSHDTASAVAACDTDGDSVYISSGTWSLIGTENEVPILSNEAMASNFTNEGGIEYRFRFLKNIMGMWIFQNIKKELDNRYSYDDMMLLAKDSRYTKRIDLNSPIFTAPENMILAIREYMNEPDLSVGDILNSAYHSLASSYADAVNTIEKITGKAIKTINIIGGGCQDKYLNQLTKEYTRKNILIGPIEATATGNILSQMMYYDKSLTLDKARKIVRNSLNIEEVV